MGNDPASDTILDDKNEENRQAQQSKLWPNDPDGCGCMFFSLGLGGGFLLLCYYVGQALLLYAQHLR